MERETINRYITNFRRYIAPYTKKDVSVKAIAYPYTNGALIVFEMGFNSSSNTDYKSESESMQEAMKKTNLFDNPEQASEISSKVIWSRNLVVVIKCNEGSYWSEKAAKNDVDNLMKSIEETRNNG